MKKSLYIILLCLIAGCSRQNAQLQFNQQTLRKMVGSPVEDVYQKLGEPKQTLVKEGKTYLIYNTFHPYENKPLNIYCYKYYEDI